MVRLKVCSIGNSATKVFKFQFQHGAIKRKAAVCAGQKFGLFQFQHGAIKRLSNMVEDQMKEIISIPTWCD